MIFFVVGSLYVLTMASLGAVFYNFCFRLTTDSPARLLATCVIFLFCLILLIITSIIKKRFMKSEPALPINIDVEDDFWFSMLVTASSLNLGMAVASIVSIVHEEVVWWVPIVFCVLYFVSFYFFVAHCIRRAIEKK